MITQHWTGGGIMDVVFAGSGDAFGSGGRFQTCIWLAAAEQTMLVDCGATSMVALKSLGLDPGAIDAVVVSHLHGDHFGGLPFLVLDGQFTRREKPLYVAGPPGIGHRLAQAMETLFPGSGQAQRRFSVVVSELALDGDAADVGAAGVRAWEVEHASGAPPLALRVTLGGATFCYSGDTQWTRALAKAARGADLFAVEAYTFDRPIRYHLDYQTLRAHRNELDAHRIVLTHMSPGMLGRLSDADIPAAYDGLHIEI
jgi:ribonuclease BN (tRNA processing enzyme)